MKKSNFGNTLYLYASKSQKMMDIWIYLNNLSEGNLKKIGKVAEKEQEEYYTHLEGEWKSLETYSDDYLFYTTKF